MEYLSTLIYIAITFLIGHYLYSYCFKNKKDSSKNLSAYTTKNFSEVYNNFEPVKEPTINFEQILSGVSNAMNHIVANAANAANGTNVANAALQEESKNIFDNIVVSDELNLME